MREKCNRSERMRGDGGGVGGVGERGEGSRREAAEGDTRGK